MRSAPKPLLALLLAALFVGSCVGGDGPTGVGSADLGLSIQPALIPSAANGTALPVHRIRTVVQRQPDGALLREQRFEVVPTAASWKIDVSVPVVGDGVEVVVYIYLLHVAGDGTEVLQFSGRTEPLTVSVGTRVSNVDADIVRGPLENLAVTAVAITSAPDTVYVGYDAPLQAAAETSGTPPEIFWTSLDPSVLTMTDSVATGVTEGTARVVASAGAHADTVQIEVVAASVDSVRVTPDSADVVVGQDRIYTALLLDANGEVTTGPVSWTTGNASIASVNASGQVTGVAPGTTTVRATSGDVFDEAVVRVIPVPTGGGANVWLGGTGNWSAAANWSLGRVPTAADTVEIGQGGEYVVTLDSDATAGALRVTSAVTLVIDDASLTLTATGPGPEVDIGASGEIALTNGGLIAEGLAIAGALRSSGISRLEVDSIANSGLWMSETGGLYLPNDGVQIETQGTVDLVSGAQIIVGTNGSFRYRGGEIVGTGSLILSPGTPLTLHEDLSMDGWLLGMTDASILTEESEILTVGPAASLVVTADVLEIQTGQLVVEGAAVITGSDVRLAGPLVIGQDGVAAVYDGGVPSTFTTGDVQIAGSLGFSGTSSIRFGPGAAGTITVDAGAVLSTLGSTTILDGQLENSGDIIIGAPTQLRREDAGGFSVTAAHRNESGAALDVVPGGNLDIYLGGTSPSTFTNAGAITVYSGATLYVENLSNPASQIIAEPGASFEGQGSVDLTGGDVDLTGVNNGAVRPGIFGPGILTWLGSVPMGPDGSIEIGIGGPEPGVGFDQLNVSSQLLLDGNGTLDIEWTYSPYMGERFPIVVYGGRSGDFANVNLPNPSGALVELQTVVTPDTPVPVPDTLVVVVLQGPSPVAADWTFDDAEGQAVFDASGQGNDGTLGTDPQLQDAADPAWTETGRFGPALSFFGQQVVRVPDSPSLEPLQFTVEAFVRGTAPGANVYVLSKGGGPSNLENAAYALYTGTGGGLTFYTTINGSTTFYPSAAIDPASVWDGQWHHVAATFNGFQVTIWLDGVQWGTASTAFLGYTTPSQDLALGALHPDGVSGFTGDLDEVRIWSRVLTGGEILERATRGAP